MLQEFCIWLYPSRMLRQGKRAGQKQHGELRGGKVVCKITPWLCTRLQLNRNLLQYRSEKKLHLLTFALLTFKRTTTHPLLQASVLPITSATGSFPCAPALCVHPAAHGEMRTGTVHSLSQSKETVPIMCVSDEINLNKLPHLEGNSQLKQGSIKMALLIRNSINGLRNYKGHWKSAKYVSIVNGLSIFLRT